MDSTQTKITELLREVHLLAIKEVERLNRRILELENEHRQPSRNAVVERPQAQPSIQADEKLMNDTQVAKYLNISVAGVTRRSLAVMLERVSGGSILRLNQLWDSPLEIEPVNVGWT